MKTSLLLVGCANEILPALSANLAATGCRLRFATSGLELLKKARRRLPDLIILDATLPDMDGATACEILSRLPSTAAVPRLLLTEGEGTCSESSPGSGASGARLGTRFNADELRRRVREMLGIAALPPGQTAGFPSTSQGPFENDFRLSDCLWNRAYSGD
jgi:CheY-like chemotaxis protein